jgi:hypothetical protein
MKIEKIISFLFLVMATSGVINASNPLQAGLQQVQAKLNSAAQLQGQKKQDEEIHLSTSAQLAKARCEALKKLDEETHHLDLTEKQLEDYQKYIYELMALLGNKAGLTPVGVRKDIVLYNESGMMKYRILKTPRDNSLASYIGFGTAYPPIRELHFFATMNNDYGIATKLTAVCKDDDIFDQINVIKWDLSTGKLIKDAQKIPNRMPFSASGPDCPEQLIATFAGGVLHATLTTNPHPGDFPDRPELSKQHIVQVNVNSRMFAPMILAQIPEKTEKEEADKHAPSAKKPKGWLSMCSGSDCIESE